MCSFRLCPSNQKVFPTPLHVTQSIISPVHNPVQSMSKANLIYNWNLPYQNHGNFSAGFAPPFGMLQPSGYQVPPPQHMYSSSAGYHPTFTPSQLPQQGMIHYDHSLPCTAIVVSFKSMLIFWLTFRSWFVWRPILFLIYIVVHAQWSNY